MWEDTSTLGWETFLWEREVNGKGERKACREGISGKQVAVVCVESMGRKLEQEHSGVVWGEHGEGRKR